MDLQMLIQSDNAQNIQVVINAADLKKCFDDLRKWCIDFIKEETDPQYLTRKEIEKRLHISTVTVYSWVKKGWLPEPVKINGRVLWEKSKVRDYINSNTKIKYIKNV